MTQGRTSSVSRQAAQDGPGSGRGGGLTGEAGLRPTHWPSPAGTVRKAPPFRICDASPSGESQLGGSKCSERGSHTLQMTSFGLPALSQEQTGPCDQGVRGREQPRDAWTLRHRRLKACVTLGRGSRNTSAGYHCPSSPERPLSLPVWLLQLRNSHGD